MADCSPPPPFVAVKAPAFSTAKLRGVDPSVGPGMQSTGEVIGIAEDPRVALGKALLGAALLPPRPGAEGALALLSIADRDKESLPRLAAALIVGRVSARRDRRDAGRRWRRRAIEARPVAKLGAAPDAERDRGRDPRSHRVPAMSGSSSTRRHRARARSATPPRSVWPRSRRASSA